jgi:hypothetical protein
VACAAEVTVGVECIQFAPKIAEPVFYANRSDASLRLVLDLLRLVPEKPPDLRKTSPHPVWSHG